MTNPLFLRRRSDKPISYVPPVPSGSKLSWSPPVLGAGGVQVVDFTLTNATRTSGTLGSGAGRDLRITNTQVLTGPLAEINGWRNIVWIGGSFVSTAVGADGHIIIRALTGTAHIEGIRFVASAQNDFIVVRWGSGSSIVQLQNCYGEVSHYGTPMHTDWFQTQVSRMAELRLDRCTIACDYQGLFLNNEPPFAGIPNPLGDSQIFQIRLRRVNFRRHPAMRSLTARWLFYSVPPNPPYDTNAVLLGPMTLEDVWLDSPSSAGLLYPTTNFTRYDGVAMKHGGYLGSDAQGSYFRFSTSADVIPSGPYVGQAAADCRVSGVVRFASPPGGDFCPSTTPGVGYVSPGYI